ncbi:unnamed protein product, partial [Mesorhabditis spiculigera]
MRPQRAAHQLWALGRRFGSTSSSSTGSAAPKTTTGIEHAEAYAKAGRATRVDPKAYLCDEYLHFNVYSYYDAEVKMSAARVPQPTNKKPDVMPRVK